MKEKASKSEDDIVLSDCLDLCRDSLSVLNALFLSVRQQFASRFQNCQKLSNTELEQNQFLAHGLAWFATYVEGLKQMLFWAEKLDAKGKFALTEKLVLQIAFGEYLAQIRGGINMSQSEIIRITDFEIPKRELVSIGNQSWNILIRFGNSDKAKRRLSMLLLETIGICSFANDGLEQEESLIREQFFKYSEKNISPFAHNWHLKDELIPFSIISDLSDLGVFSLTIPDKFGGLGMKKTAMCVVSEELSRGYIGVGSLATRSDIAAELILCGGTSKQKNYWLPKIASGEVLPTAVFTEPDTGSDLGSLKTRAVLNDSTYKITGNKTWITHAARTHMMTLLARTDHNTKDYSGLSMFLAEKSPGTEENPFPTEGINGTEIKVLGYRGMKEYELNFDNFKVRKQNLLGNIEGQGFRQLMETFESARIQTAARAIGVAQSALDEGLKYASERRQFGKKIINYPRIYHKLSSIAVELMIAKQLTYFSSREKDAGRRCDLEAGMSKMLSARVAWSAADNALQIHGGNGFALEYKISRILCDARILSIFEGAAEIQAQVIARRLLESLRN